MFGSLDRRGSFDVDRIELFPLRQIKKAQGEQTPNGRYDNDNRGDACLDDTTD